MYSILSGSDAGRMPSLNDMPMDLIKSLLLLEQLPSVGVVNSKQNQDNVHLQIAFRDNTIPDYRRAIKCFAGFKPKALRLDGRYRLLQLTLQTAKAVA